MNRVCSICGEIMIRSAFTAEDMEEYRETVVNHYRGKHSDLYIFLEWLIEGDKE